METSSFQVLKLQVVEILGLSKDAIHIHIGMICLTNKINYLHLFFHL